MRTVLDAIDNPRVAQARVLPVLFVVEHDPSALAVLISDLSRRFGNDFEVSGRTSPDAALTALRNLATAERPVALLLVDGAASEEFLACAHRVHPQAKRVLLVDRDYSSASPAVQAMTLGRVDYHIVRPWANDETMYRAMSEYLSSWTREQEPKFEQFRIVGAEGDIRALKLRDVMSRFSLPFRFYALESDPGRRLLTEPRQRRTLGERPGCRPPTTGERPSFFWA